MGTTKEDYFTSTVDGAEGFARANCEEEDDDFDYDDADDNDGENEEDDCNCSDPGCPCGGSKRGGY